ncbi:unnamed protein product [Effrenium voratum]|nr:unnamed protein product [Effrenium voratum]
MHQNISACSPSMAKRGSKLLALALPILVGRSFFAVDEIPRTTPSGHKHPSKTTRASINLQKSAEYLEPLATVFGTSLKEIGQGVLEANNNFRSISKQTSLAQLNNAQAHAERLANILVENAKQRREARNIFVPNVSLPLIPVNGTQFQQLMSNVLSDTALTGVTAVYAEPGVGKSVAVALAMLGWAKDNPLCITVLVRQDLARLKDFFNVADISFVPRVAELIFPILSDAGVRLQLILDNIFDDELGEDGKRLMNLARAAHRYGQVIVVTQSERIANKVACLNGARTRLAPQQENVSQYRWNEVQARQLLLYLNATEKVKNSSKPRKARWWRWSRAVLQTRVETQLEKAVQKTKAEFREDELLISKALESASLPDGGWKPTDIIEFLLSGKKPVTAIAGAASAPPAVWVRQLQPSKDGKDFEIVGNAFQVKGGLTNVDDLKKAIDPSFSPFQSSKIDIYSQKDGRWVREDEEAAVKCGRSKADCYGFMLPAGAAGAA